MSVLLLLLLLVAGDAHLLSEMYGSLQSPNFPEPYPWETELRWNVSVPPGFQVRLYFSHFDLEPSYLCEYDYVKVEAEGEVLALFCGREETDTETVPAQQIITSPRNSINVVFCSDFSNEERYSGFMAHYSAVVECSDRVFRERSGVFSSVDFPSSYPKSSECVYRIEVEPGFKLRLQFDPRFDVEDHPDVSCPYDHIQITAGSSQFGPFCGERSPGEIQTDSNVVTVFFHSDNSGDNLGWRITYTSTGSQCAAPEVPPNGVLTPVQSEYSFRDHILFTCSPGYTLIKDGQSLDYFQVDCLSDGSWTSGPPACRKDIPGDAPEDA